MQKVKQIIFENFEQTGEDGHISRNKQRNASQGESGRKTNKK